MSEINDLESKASAQGDGGKGEVFRNYDVVIVGGGPSGSAAAMTLLQDSPGLAVAVLENTTYAEPRAGELLAATAQTLLEQLGVWETFLAVEYPRTRSISSTWGNGEPFGQGILDGSLRPGWQLNRRCFDRFLADEACKRGAHVYTGTTIHQARLEGDLWHLEIRSAQSSGRDPLEIRTRFVIDATGRNASFAIRRGARRIALDKLTGAFVFFSFESEADSSAPFDGEDRPLIESCEHGWWYSSRISSTELSIALFTDADIASQLELGESMSWTTLLEETHYTRDRIRHAVSQTHPELIPVDSHRLDRMRGERWLATGDAAASCDPLASHGINRALCSGILAACAVSDFFRGNRVGPIKYEGLMIAEYEDHLKIRSELYRQELQWKHAPFWKRRQADITLHPERVVRLQQQAPNLYQFAGIYLSLRELKLLCEICSHPSPAHEIVAAFRAQRKSVAPDVTVMAALQHLIDAGVLSCAVA